ncbi:hypothetical protein LPB19_01105 [Marinobacter salinisoli]|uniref:Ribosomal RNA methyltransferase FtsJ domain-containing protein n=1 Tax=Marinobacter salinisoli TaxID=2769486 RepID=A0ABX7MVC6_9GAMM|nr:SAM-dependent methyltransferase [Marinobacter salinisoli]QSP95051.1 hypothetical protein LPB19_01105 [Marinobacter salinisoli]
MSGMATVDNARVMDLMKSALGMAKHIVTPGVFVTSVLQGEGVGARQTGLCGNFETVVSCKPDSSRSCTREILWVCRGFKG